MTIITRAAVIALLSTTSLSCSPKQATEKPISSVDFDTFRLADTLRDRATHIFVTDRSVGFTLCDRAKSPCGKQYEIANENGVHVLLWKPDSTWDLRPMSDKPRNAKKPDDVPMINMPNKLMIDFCRTGSPNWYPLSRLHLGKVGYTTFTTTSAHWPLVSCYDTTPLSWICGVGFSIKGAFAEVSFGRKSHDLPSQSEIWALASAVDAEIRAVSVRTRPPHAPSSL